MGKLIYSSRQEIIGSYPFIEDYQISLTSKVVQSVGRFDGDEASHLDQLLKADDANLRGEQ